MTLYSHQQTLINRNPKRHGIWWETGTGKSLALIELARKNNVNALLICPKSIRERWQRDAPSFTVITKEESRRDHKKLPRCDALIIDEAHAFASPKSQLFKAADWYVTYWRPKYIWLATATPYRSTPWNCYALARILGYHFSWLGFRERFFRERYLGRRTVWVPKEDARSKRELKRLYSMLGDFIKLEDCIDMPEAVWEEETFPLTREQEAATAALDEANPMVRYAKLHQIENGSLKGNEYTPDLRIACLKTERVVEIALETPKLAVFAKYTLQVSQLASALERAGLKVYTLTGGTKNADQVIREAESAPECVIVINTDKAEGYELPSFRNVVYASLPWSLVSFTQSQGRFRRINKPQRVSYTILTSEGKVDKAVKAALDKKTDFQLELFAKENA